MIEKRNTYDYRQNEIEDDPNFQEFVNQFTLSLARDMFFSLSNSLCVFRDIYKFIESRSPDQSKINIFNPTVEANGYQSGFTEIQILNTDMPFLVDSFTESIKSNGLIIQQRINAVLAIERDDKGVIKKIFPISEKEALSYKESIIYFSITKIDEEAINYLKINLLKVLAMVKIAVKDWPLMKEEASKCKESIKLSNEPEPIKNEIKEFLNWLNSGNFIFLGFAEYRWDNSKLVLEENSILGIMKIEEYFQELLRTSKDIEFINYNSDIYITRADYISQVHRRVNLDYIRIKKYNKQGNLKGELKFFGLFTSILLLQSIRNIPLIRQKVKQVEQMSHFVSGGHNNKTLISILQDFARSELFHIPVEELYKTCMGMFDLTIKPKFKLFIHTDEIGLFVRGIIFIPLKQFSMKLWYNLKNIIINEFQGKPFDEYILISEAELVRLQLVLKVESIDTEIKVEELEKKLSRMARDWKDMFRDVLLEKLDNFEADKLFNFYGDIFPNSYKEVFSASNAYYDLKYIEKIKAFDKIEASLYMVDECFHLKLYAPVKRLELFRVLPVLENMFMRVLDHYSYKIENSSGFKVWLHHFILEIASNASLELEEIKEEFEITLIKALNKEIEDDYYNSLVILAGLKWREVAIFRAWGSYLKQIGFSYSQSYIQQSLIKHPEAVKCLMQLFNAKFIVELEEQSNSREKQLQSISNKMDKILNQIRDVVDDKIIRSFIEINTAILRTNYYLNKPYISFKIDSRQLSNMPLPCPFVEIYVYANYFEAIHLRGGKVARGGIRWSDRSEDYRTEILGLMKAQMLKNACIAPVGAKGGFIVKGDKPEKREDWIKKGLKAYQDFFRGLLDITDNIDNHKVHTSPNLVCYDKDDPYLVVAADKGTASFADYANAISAEYNFWLGDAFASGGSAGYDHKAIAITSRGALIAAMTHAWARGIDLKKETITVVGIGDMSGDVFGNGLLLLNNCYLIASFNGNEIFIDPSPDPSLSYKERERLFKEGLTWSSYNKAVLSSGGGVFSRGVKSITLNPTIQQLFGIKETTVSPNQLINYILKAKVDLIWNGGIGTYVKAINETHELVEDKSNDAVRVNGSELRAAMFIEGGNLGCTQLGRIEYSKKGGYINTDFIDNSAGVNCSDVEVNIKIAFSIAIAAGKITQEERDKMLKVMTNEVTAIVLKTNENQCRALVLEYLRTPSQLEHYQRLINRLEKNGILNRAVEFLPSNEEIAHLYAEKRSFEKPQIAVLISTAKMYLYESLVKSDLPDNQYLTRYLIDYFPKLVQEGYKEEILNHPLKREIIATCITNDIVNRIGCTFVGNVVENLGLLEAEVVRVLLAVIDSYSLTSLWDNLDKLIGSITVYTYSQVHQKIHLLVNYTAYWFFRNYPRPVNISLAVEEFYYNIEIISKNLTSILDPESLKGFTVVQDTLIAENLPKSISYRIASLEFLAHALAIVQVTNNLRFYGKVQVPILVAGKMYFAIGSVLQLSWLRERLQSVEGSSYWQRLAIKTLVDEIYDRQMLLASEAAKHLNEGESYIEAIEKWKEANQLTLSRYESFLNDIKGSEAFDLSKLLILIKRLGSIVQ